MEERNYTVRKRVNTPIHLQVTTREKPNNMKIRYLIRLIYLNC